MLNSLRTSSIASEVVGDHVVVVHAVDAPTDEEWRQNVALQTSLPPDRARVLVWTDGGAPNAKQRALLNAALKGGQPLTAVLTPSKAGQAVGVAISWFNPRLRIFAPTEIELALDHLNILGSDRWVLKDTLARLRQELLRLPTTFAARR
jgi:hypothetical protein